MSLPRLLVVRSPWWYFNCLRFCLFVFSALPYDDPHLPHSRGPPRSHSGRMSLGSFVLLEAAAPEMTGTPSTRYFDWLSLYSGLNAVILNLWD